MIDKHPPCPKGHPLVVRKSSYGKFFGCLTYPEHKIIVERPDCPNGHIMSIRTGPYGEFFGCIEYPECKETYNFEVQNSKYHSRLWRDFENSELLNKNNAHKTNRTKNNMDLEEPLEEELEDFEEDNTPFQGRTHINKHEARAHEFKKNIPNFSEIEKFSEDVFTNEMKVFIDNKNYTSKAKRDKNHPESDTRLPINLSEEEKNEYERLYQSEYSNHILLKVPSHLLKKYLQKSLKFKRTLN